jgi:uncharacterized membrane protein YGL010W
MLKPALANLFQSYADSHRHPTNRLTHKIAIPMIVFHIIAMLDWVRFTDGGVHVIFQAGGPGLSLATLIFAAAVTWYLSMNVKLGLVMAVLYGVCFPLGWFAPWPVVVTFAVVGWLIQLAGHSVWEKNRPAFLTNMLQALVGPLFFAAVLLGDWPAKTVPAATKQTAA